MGIFGWKGIFRERFGERFWEIWELIRNIMNLILLVFFNEPKRKLFELLCISIKKLQIFFFIEIDLTVLQHHCLNQMFILNFKAAPQGPDSWFCEIQTKLGQKRGFSGSCLPCVNLRIIIRITVNSSIRKPLKDLLNHWNSVDFMPWFLSLFRNLWKTAFRRLEKFWI